MAATSPPEPGRGSWVQITSRIKLGSPDLAALFERGTATPLANDTSIGCGFAPFTELECVVLDVERTLNGPAARYSCPALGQDIKVMGIRHGSEISLTIACAFVDRYTANRRRLRSRERDRSPGC